MTKFIAHRGLSARFPENTHAAFDAAWQSDCDGIELDVQVSKDGDVLVIHDPDTARVANEAHVIADSHWADLQHLDVGKGERIPRLSEVIAKMPAGKIVQIELKHHINNDDAMDSVIHLLGNLRTDIVAQVISFDPDKLIRVQQTYPELTCLFLVPENDAVIEDPIGLARTQNFAGLGLAHCLATRDFVAKIKAADLKIGTWTVNDPGRARELVELSVDFITSDVTDTFMAMG